MSFPKICVGDILVLKKSHPCGSNKMRALRAGSDVRIICLGCQRDMTLPREKLEKSIKNIEHSENGEER